MAKPRLEPGAVLEGFTLVELLHKGGMAHLWKVAREDGGDQLLMKVPVLHEGEDPASIVGFEMEQMIMPRLSGIHVPRFIANGDFARQPFIVMELLKGTSLLPKLKELPLAPDEVARIGAIVATALDDLHRQRVVHLDVKPSNIMFRPTGEAVLIDYGLSRHLDLPDFLAEEFRLPYGTAPYMAPEQVMGVRHDFRSDLFALGVLLYFFSTGVRPFGDPQRLTGLKKRIWRDPKPPRALNQNIPPWLQEIILRCLEVRASLRLATAAQLAFDLQHPQQVKLTARAERMKEDGFFAVLRRKSEPLESLIDRVAEPTAGLADAPIVAVTVDFETAAPDLLDLLRTTVKRILDRTPMARVACVNVLRQSRIALDTTLDEQGNSKHVARIVQLKDWARKLAAPDGTVSYHVLEAVDPADAILDYVRNNAVDHVVMGARENSTKRKLLGSVSARVASEAPCTVTVVRNRKKDD